MMVIQSSSATMTSLGHGKSVTVISSHSKQGLLISKSTVWVLTNGQCNEPVTVNGVTVNVNLTSLGPVRT